MAALDEGLAALGAVLVEERVLRRVIKAHRRVRAVGLSVPHVHCYALPRAELERFVEPGELPVDPAALPARVLLARGDRGALEAGGPEALTALWRAIFHARVHQAFDELLGAKALTPAAVRERVHRIGQAEFDEIRSVVRQEDLLLPPIDEVSTYVEFAALYLELRGFAPDAVARTFPAVIDTAQLDAVIALDVDAAALLAAARPPGAPEAPLIAPPPAPPEPAEERLGRPVPSAARGARRARQKGNQARAAILAARAGDPVAARADLHELSLRLSRALGGAPADGWVEALLPLVQRTATRRRLRFGAGARLMHDLVAACTVAEREAWEVDAVAWALSRRKRPLVRPLPATREVRIAKHVHAAAAKLPACGLSGEAREALAAALHAMARRADDQVRAALRQKLEAALDEVGLTPHSLPERVAQKTLIDELLDRAVATGRLTLGDLRDALSRNDLKLQDLTASELRGGDALLRADAILASSLDGVYRRGEIYLRGLQKLSSILFGTWPGRLATRFALLPLLGAFAVLQGLQHMVGPLVKKLSGDEPEIYSLESLGVGAAFLFLLLHAPPFRRGVARAGRALGRGVRFVAVDVLGAALLHPVTQAILQSRPVRWVIKPALPAALAGWLVDRAWGDAWAGWGWVAGGAAYVLAAGALSSRLGRRAEEMGIDYLVRSTRHVTGHLAPALIRYVLELFAGLLELFERALYRVDEWLRFRGGQSAAAVVVKGALGAIWFVVAYVLRLSVNLFIEPTVNPIKHFPVVTVAAKLILPFTEAMLSAIAGPASSVLGPVAGNAFAAFAVLMLPGLAGFLVWELKENWRLYRATRPRELRPRPIGHHGETMARFLRPGFHSGTLPKAFTRLRRAAWQRDERAVARQREALHHVEDAVGLFVERQLIAMLEELPAFAARGGRGIQLGGVQVGSNRVQIVLMCPGAGPEPATIRFELQSGWLVAGIPAPGWIGGLGDEARRIFEVALAGLYKLAAVDVAREQLEHALARGPGAPAPPYDIADEGLVVWPARGFEVEIVYDLAERRAPVVRGDDYRGEVIDLEGRHAMFGHAPIYASVWTTAWQQLARGEAPPPVIAGPGLLPDARPGPAPEPAPEPPAASPGSPGPSA